MTAVLDELTVRISKSSRLANGEHGSFREVIEIEGDGAPFSGPGDFGSLVYSLEDGRAVGILFASSRSEKRTRSFAHPVAQALDGLGLDWA